MTRLDAWLTSPMQADEEARLERLDLLYADEAVAKLPAILADPEDFTDCLSTLGCGPFNRGTAEHRQSAALIAAMREGDHCEAGRLLAVIAAPQLADAGWASVTGDHLDTACDDAQAVVLEAARKLLGVAEPLTVPAVTPPKAPAFTVEG